MDKLDEVGILAPGLVAPNTIAFGMLIPTG